MVIDSRRKRLNIENRVWETTRLSRKKQLADAVSKLADDPPGFGHNICQFWRQEGRRNGTLGVSQKAYVQRFGVSRHPRINHAMRCFHLGFRV